MFYSCQGCHFEFLLKGSKKIRLSLPPYHDSLFPTLPQVYLAAYNLAGVSLEQQLGRCLRSDSQQLAHKLGGHHDQRQHDDHDSGLHHDTDGHDW